MQYIKQLVNQSKDQLIDLEGKIRSISYEKLGSLDMIRITFIIENEELTIYGYIQIKNIDLQPNFKYLITKLQIGTINNQFCGIMTPQSQILCEKTDLELIQQQKELELYACRGEKICKPQSAPQLINPFQIDLLQLFQKDDFQLGGIMLYKLNQKLHNFKVSTLVGYVYKIQIQKNVVELHLLDELTYTPFIIDLQYSQQQQVEKIKFGYKLSLQNLQKQNRALLNSFKGFLQDQQIIDFDVLKCQPKDSLSKIYKKLDLLRIMPFSQLKDIQPYTIDRQLRKFKTDIIKTNMISFQYVCTGCRGQIKVIAQSYICENCQTEKDLKDSIWEIFCLIYVKIGIEYALVRIKDQLVMEYFDIPAIYENYMQKYSLQKSGSIKDDNIEADESIKYLQQQFYKKKVSKMILALPYCDFIKTAKTKEKWKMINKLKNLSNDHQDDYSDYQVWIEKNDYEKLIVNPNGSFEQVIRDQSKDRWFLNRDLEPITCLECLDVRDVDLSYFNYIKAILK